MENPTIVKVLLVLGLGRGRDSGQSASVERAKSRDDNWFIDSQLWMGWAGGEASGEEGGVEQEWLLYRNAVELTLHKK